MIKEDKPIIVLDQSSNTTSFGRANLVHGKQYDRVIDLISKALKNATLNNDNIRRQETISILGSRGSGKTSFLLSLIAHYRNGRDTDTSGIQVLDIIDPTLIEQKGHFFLYIIAQIQTLVENKISNWEHCDDLNSDTFCKKRCWLNSLKKLAGGLPSIDGICHPNEDSWQDPEFIMDNGLRVVNSAQNLETNFHKFINESLSILGKKMFLLPLDDIDVDFLKGWPILETIRKYITTPQILTLLCGDLTLFSKVVRKMQWKNLGKALLINEAEREKYIHDYDILVTELESQYLQKVMKPERRIRLNTLWEKHLVKDDIEVTFQQDSDRSPEKIIDIYKDILKTIGIFNSNEARCYYTFLMKQPLRTQVQFLVDYRNRGDIISPFLSYLYEENIEVDTLRSVPELIIPILLHFLLRKRLLKQAYQLQPTYLNDSVNGTLLSFNFVLSKQYKENPSLIFDYIVHLGYISTLVDLLGYDNRNSNSPLDRHTFSIEGLCNYAECFQDTILKNLAAKIQSYLDGINTPNVRLVTYGNVKLKSMSKRLKQKKEETNDRIDTVFRNRPRNVKAIAYFPLFTSSRTDRNNQDVNYSMFVLLGTLGDLLKSTDIPGIANEINKRSQLRNYQQPDFGMTGSSSELVQASFTDDEGMEDKSIKQLAEEISAWKERGSELIISSHELGKIVRRIYYAFGNIENGVTNLGELMHRQIIALFNAFLIEDAKEHMEDSSSINYNNTVSSSKIFADNLQKILSDSSNNQKGHDFFALSRWILSCPILLSYLNFKEIESWNRPDDFYHFINVGQAYDVWIQKMEKETIYDDLCKVSLGEESKLESELPEFKWGNNNEVKITLLELMKHIGSYRMISEDDYDTYKEKYNGKIFKKKAMHKPFFSNFMMKASKLEANLYNIWRGKSVETT